MTETSDSDKEIVEAHILASGRVQGVGFRSTVWRHAQRFGVTGTVHNVPDGTVAICAQGTRSQIELFLKTIEVEPGMGRVFSLQIIWQPIQNRYSQFSIR